MAFIEGLAGSHHLGAESIGLGEQLLVGWRQAIDLVRRITVRKTVLALPVLLDVASSALDKMPRNFDALRLRKG